MKKPVSIRKKPVTIEAIRWTGDNIEAVQAFVGKARDCPPRSKNQVYPSPGFDVHLKDTGPEAYVWDYLSQMWVRVFEGQWVLRGILGEYYPNDDESLRQTYDFLSGDGQEVQPSDVQ